MNAVDIVRGEDYVWASNETSALTGNGKRAHVLKVESVKEEGKTRGVKMALVTIDGMEGERHVPPKALFGLWAPYHQRHQEARRAARDAVETSTRLLAQLVGLGVVEEPPGPTGGAREDGGIHYWLSPVRYRRTPDGSPLGVEIHLKPLAVERLVAVLEQVA